MPAAMEPCAGQFGKLQIPCDHCRFGLGCHTRQAQPCGYRPRIHHPASTNLFVFGMVDDRESQIDRVSQRLPHQVGIGHGVAIV